MHPKRQQEKQGEVKRCRACATPETRSPGVGGDALVPHPRHIPPGAEGDALVPHPAHKKDPC